MRSLVRRLVVAGASALLFTGGCAQQNTRAHTHAAQSPEDKAHQEQLDRMSAEDEQQLSTESSRSDRGSRRSQDRDRRQHVIDQPGPSR